VLPSWYGVAYPTVEKMEAYAWQLGAVVMRGPVPAFCSLPTNECDVAVIGIPETAGPLEMAWLLAHELGHLALHLGYISPWTRDRQELQAGRWAACALIPEARIQAHRNASMGAFVGALSAHFEELPLICCHPRRLAGKIAKIRLSILEEKAANGY
jgi:hypothetical protein